MLLGYYNAIVNKRRARCEFCSSSCRVMGERNRSINKHRQLVVSIDKLRANLPEAVTLFRSYMASHDPYRDGSIVEAARATSAAPTFFKPK